MIEDEPSRFFAHKKRYGFYKRTVETQNQRDLVLKEADGQFVKAGNILYSTAWYKDSPWVSM